MLLIKIKGMEMPERCGVCRFGFLSECTITGSYIVTKIERNSDCPLVELPKQHGRLIDADHLERRMCDTVQGNIRGYGYDSSRWDLAFAWLDEEDTIVEAEEGE